MATHLVVSLELTNELLPVPTIVVDPVVTGHVDVGQDPLVTGRLHIHVYL